jgi:hypothetical protein
MTVLPYVKVKFQNTIFTFSELASAEYKQPGSFER